MTEKPNHQRARECRNIMERDTLRPSFFFWLAILTLIIVLAAWSSTARGDTCVFYECPYGEVVWLENGGVTFSKTNTKDCKLMGRGDERSAREFETNNRGKHLMFDCKKEKKK